MFDCNSNITLKMRRISRNQSAVLNYIEKKKLCGKSVEDLRILLNKAEDSKRRHELNIRVLVEHDRVKYEAIKQVLDQKLEEEEAILRGKCLEYTNRLAVREKTLDELKEMLETYETNSWGRRMIGIAQNEDYKFICKVLNDAIDLSTRKEVPDLRLISRE